jgi:predicted transcriptional regulator
MIAFLFTPIGRYLAIAVLIVVALGGIYVKIRADAVAEISAAATADALRRVQDAVSAGDSAVISSERLLETDGHRRD